MQATFKITEHHVRRAQLVANLPERFRRIFDVHQIDIASQNQFFRQDSPPFASGALNTLPRSLPTACPGLCAKQAIVPYRGGRLFRLARRAIRGSD
jgi:hypothetical protein